MVIVPAFFDHSQRKAIRDAGAISGLFVCRISNEPEPVTKPRGCPGEEPLSQAKSSLQGESCIGTSEPVPEPMLWAAFCLLQMAHLLLQSGQQAREVEEKAAKRATRVSVGCQATLDEEDMGLDDESSGYGSDSSSLVEEVSPNYASHESGVISQTSPSNMMETVSNVTAANVLKPVLSHAKQGVRKVAKELPKVGVSCQAGFESGGADRPGVLPHQGGQAEVMPGQALCLPGSSTSRPPEALVHPHLVGVAGVVPGQAYYLPGPCTPELRVRPPQVGGLAKDLGHFVLHRSPLLRA